jgi:small subunit ribosomal protein S17
MPKLLSGEIVKIISDSASIIEIKRVIMHPKYRKQMKRTTRVKAVTTGKGTVGDTVTIAQIRPVSKEINWKVMTKEKKEKHDTA